MLAEVGDFREADAILRSVGDEIEFLDDRVQATTFAVFRAHIELAAGRLEAAAAAATDGLATAEAMGAPSLIAAASGVLATVALRRGDLRGAAQHLARCRAELTGDLLELDAVRYAWVEAQLADAEDGPTCAMALLAGTYDGLPAGQGLFARDPAAAPWMVRTALAVGDQNRAGGVVAAAEQLAAANPGFPTVVAAAEHARGLLDRDPAKVVQAAGRHRHPWARASAAEDAGVLLAGRGDRDGAVASFDQAVAAYQHAGAERDVARVRRRLRQLGVRRRHWRVAARPICGLASLTDTERNVADLVAEGLTNRQVAQRMFLSPHTIDFHLRQIYRKLNIGSRVELARLISDRNYEETLRADSQILPQLTEVAG
jgi:DNA-binding CsgD family transcriptional regulator